MPDVDPSKVLFIGNGKSAVGWYRCYLPAMMIGADWIGVIGEPPDMHYVTGLVKGRTTIAPFESYEHIVIQQPRGRGWLKLIRGLQERGIRVYYEVDDYLHAIRKMEDHDYRQFYDKDALADLELCMRACDAMIVSTPFLRHRYRHMARSIHLCENGVDMGRYRLTRPPRPTVNIGWAGATGHRKAALPWIAQVGNVMLKHEDTCFVSIGQDFASAFRPHFGDRALSIPFTMIECYPAAMTMFDVAIAPAGKGNFFRGKSDLRWVEASALGIAVVADPDVYPNIVHGETGFHASSPEEARELVSTLVQDADLRTRIGTQAQEDVRARRDARVTSMAWLEVFSRSAA